MNIFAYTNILIYIYIDMRPRAFIACVFIYIKNICTCIYHVYIVVCCSVLQCVAVCCSVSQVSLRCAAVRCSVLQCVAVCCSVLQYISEYHSTLQCVAVCCSERSPVKRTGEKRFVREGIREFVSTFNRH